MASLALLLPACATGSGPGSGRERGEPATVLAGRWQKISTDACAAAYPDTIEFFHATYLGKKGQSGQRFIVWDAGGYQVMAADQVKIDTAWDEQVVYTFVIASNVLTVRDRDGCEFRYRRVT